MRVRVLDCLVGRKGRRELGSQEQKFINIFGKQPSSDLPVLKAIDRNLDIPIREHDELRYSIRSAIASLSPQTIATIHLVVGDSPSYHAGLLPENLLNLAPASSNLTTRASTDRSAQVPRWIDLSTISFGESSTSYNPAPSFQIHSHSELFKTSASTRRAAQDWQDSVLPSFNSLAIESQLANLEMESPTAVYLNDDFFLNEVSSSSSA